MKLRSLIIAIVIGLFALIIVGTNAYGWISTHRSLLLLNRTVTTPPATAVFVAKSAPAVISFLANIDELANLHRLATPAALQRTEYHTIREWEKHLADRLHLDYHREIAPWLGEEITFAITDLDFDRLPQNGYEPGYMAVLSSRNPRTSSQKIHAWWARQVAANRLAIESVQGIEIAYNQRDRVASAIIGTNILFANHPKVLREAINHLQTSSLSILDNPAYQRVLAANNHHKIGVGYAHLPTMKRWLGQDIDHHYAEFGINLGIDRQGLIADVALYPQSEITAPSPSPTTPINAIKYLPRQSTIAIAGTDLQHWQQQLANILPLTKSQTLSIDRSLTDLSKHIGIDLAQDIFSWATGEYALAAVPNPTHKLTDWVFIAERSQPDRVDAAIAHFDELASIAGYNVGLLPWQDRQVIGWTKLVTTSNSDPTQLIIQVPGVHTTIADKYTIFASSVEAMDLTLKTIDQQSILESDRYQQAAPLLAANQSGYLYGNWQTISSLLPDRLRSQSIFKLVSAALCSGLPNISMNSNTEAGIQQIGILLQPDQN